MHSNLFQNIFRLTDNLYSLSLQPSLFSSQPKPLQIRLLDCNFTAVKQTSSQLYIHFTQKAYKYDF